MILELLEELWSTLIVFVQDVFESIFGGWNYQAILVWLPQDIRSSIDTFILVLFCIVLIKLVKDFIPH